MYYEVMITPIPYSAPFKRARYIVRMCTVMEALHQVYCIEGLMHRVGIRIRRYKEDCGTRASLNYSEFTEAIRRGWVCPVGRCECAVEFEEPTREYNPRLPTYPLADLPTIEAEVV